MKTCIAYFSRMGNTKTVAEYLAGKLKADVICLHDAKGYKGFFGFMKGGFKASTGKLETIDADIYRQIEQYDRLILGAPVWAGKTNPYLNAVLENTDLAGKEVFVITVQADPDFGGSREREALYKEKIKAKQAKFGGYYKIQGNGPGSAPKSEAEIAPQVDKNIKIK